MIHLRGWRGCKNWVFMCNLFKRRVLSSFLDLISCHPFIRCQSPSVIRFSSLSSQAFPSFAASLSAALFCRLSHQTSQTRAAASEEEGRAKEMTETKEKSKKARGGKRKGAFPYGNYKYYYGYRVDRNVGEDPRLSVMKREWFEGKDCLDIGCNQGLITITIAKKFICRSMLGIDIDAGLIEVAQWNLRNMARMENAKSKSSSASKSEATNGTDGLEHDVLQVPREEICHSLVDASPKGGDLLKRVSFQNENFVETLQEGSELYDTILCLSVTKWIHLNWGDDGLITLFVKIWRLLRPNGVLLLEPQPWSSYRRNKLVSEATRANFSEIHIHPHAFRELLLDKVGFRSAETVTNSLSGSVAGFDRPIIVFRK